jgi:hypothetical protein
MTVIDRSFRCHLRACRSAMASQGRLRPRLCGDARQTAPSAPARRPPFPADRSPLMQRRCSRWLAADADRYRWRWRSVSTYRAASRSAVRWTAAGIANYRAGRRRVRDVQPIRTVQHVVLDPVVNHRVDLHDAVQRRPLPVPAAVSDFRRCVVLRWSRSRACARPSPG